MFIFLSNIKYNSISYTHLSTLPQNSRIQAALSSPANPCSLRTGLSWHTTVHIWLAVLWDKASSVGSTSHLLVLQCTSKYVSKYPAPESRKRHNIAGQWWMFLPIANKQQTV